MEDKLENLQALIEGSGLGMYAKGAGMSEARSCGYWMDIRLMGCRPAVSFHRMGFAGARTKPVEGACGRRL